MSDIKDRLQVCIDSEDGYWPTCLAKDALDKIKTLTDALERTIQGQKNLIELELIPTRYIASVKAEIERTSEVLGDV